MNKDSTQGQIFFIFYYFQRRKIFMSAEEKPDFFFLHYLSSKQHLMTTESEKKIKTYNIYLYHSKLDFCSLHASIKNQVSMFKRSRHINVVSE